MLGKVRLRLAHVCGHSGWLKGNGLVDAVGVDVANGCRDLGKEFLVTCGREVLVGLAEMAPAYDLHHCLLEKADSELLMSS